MKRMVSALSGMSDKAAANPKKHDGITFEQAT
jgi:hypothetical protein